MDALQQSKAFYRQQARQNFRALSVQDIEHESNTITEIIKGSVRWQRAKTVLLYVPMVDEPNISPLLEDAINANKRLYLPQYDAAASCYHIAPVQNLARDLKPGKYAIPEPITSAVTGVSVDLAIVPGLCFSKTGARMGRGKGYYDRLLSSEIRFSFVIGISWSNNLFEQIPTEANDIAMSAVISAASGFCLSSPTNKTH